MLDPTVSPEIFGETGDAQNQFCGKSSSVERDLQFLVNNKHNMSEQRAAAAK